MASNKSSYLVNAALPKDFYNGPNLTSGQATSYIQRMINTELPRGDLNGVPNGLRWKFLLDKHKPKIIKKKKNMKKTFLTRRERLKMDLLKLPQTGWNYESLKPMREMWKNYMRQNLDLIGKAPSCTDQEWLSFSTIIAKSELIGSELTVVKSKVPSQIGLSGTVVLETKMTFQIVTPLSALKTIIKDSSVFQFRLDSMKFTVFGKHIATRPSDRSVKKIKGQMVPDL